MKCSRFDEKTNERREKGGVSMASTRRKKKEGIKEMQQI
jgi:hypothetical protein